MPDDAVFPPSVFLPVVAGRVGCGVLRRSIEPTRDQESGKIAAPSKVALTMAARSCSHVPPVRQYSNDAAGPFKLVNMAAKAPDRAEWKANRRYLSVSARQQ